MLALIAVLAGFAFGWVRAARRGGTTGDRVQYGIAHGVAFGLIGVLVSIVLLRTGLF